MTELNFILIFGLCPSNRPYDQIKGNPSINKLDRWVASLDIRKDYIFHNIIEFHKSKPRISDVNKNRIRGYASCSRKILALGNFVSNILSKFNIDHFKLPHPSPLNRKLNDKKFEHDIIESCREYLII